MMNFDWMVIIYCDDGELIGYRFGADSMARLITEFPDGGLTFYFE